jgi:asparagine synthase (glutamine-hydrolysing)
MCGIAGFADPLTASDPRDSERLEADTRLVRAMCAVIRHRGPDDEGVRVEPGFGLGMRRLSIIDLHTGHQPIGSEDECVQVVFNGEIYNFRELRDELVQAGHRFATTSDTEVIVHGYEQWGRGVFERLRGMFGIAVWDRRARTLWLARDRAGIKPLYYVEHAGRLFYGSELKSLLAAGAVERAIDPAALAHYLAFLYTPPDRAIFHGVRKLPPGHVLCWHAGQAAVTPFWHPPADEAGEVDEREAEEQLLACLRDAVRSHLVSDVPLGAFLSGGIDSSLVVALMAEASSRPVKTFSIGFDEPAYDELDAARLVARHLGADHHEFVVRPDALAIVERIVSHFDEPFADPSAIPTWYVSELARQHVTVVLSGDGGDELFAGYDRYVPHPRVARFDTWPVPGKRALAALAARTLPHGARGQRFLRHVAGDEDDRYIETLSFFGPEDRRALVDPAFACVRQGAPEDLLRARFAQVQHLPPVSRMMRVDFGTYLPEDVLTKVDRMSMAHSIESRVPLLDHPLVEFALRLPLALKLRGDQRKYLLKRVAARVLPDSVLARRKQGFGVPLGVWFRGSEGRERRPGGQAARLRDAFQEVLLSSRARHRGYFEAREVRRLLDEHLAGRRNHDFRLWQLFMFELWHREYVDRAPATADRLPAVLAHR